MVATTYVMTINSMVFFIIQNLAPTSSAQQPVVTIMVYVRFIGTYLAQANKRPKLHAMRPIKPVRLVKECPLATTFNANKLINKV